MKVITDSDIKQLVVEALDYNAHVVALCTAYFGNMNDKNSKKFNEDFLKLVADTDKRRKQILGIGDE